jgi:hypothetical protein
VFTKYDLLVTSEIRKGRAAARGWSTEQCWLDGEEKAKKAFEELCVHPLTQAIGEVRIAQVSGMPLHPLIPIARMTPPFRA